MPKTRYLVIDHSVLGRGFHDNHTSAFEAEIESLLDSGEVGDSITITVVELDEREVEELGEWDGW